MIISGYLYLMIIYIVWGTTYLAMRIGVAPGSGFPVFAFGAYRCLVAAGLLLLFSLLRKQSIKPNRKELFYLAFTGIGMWAVAHGMVLVAEQYIDSGFAAIAVATSPLWVLLLGSGMDKTKPDLRHIFFVCLGFLGIATLMYPEIRKANIHSTLSLILLVISPMAWAFCALWVKRNPQKLSTFTQSGYQHLFGGLGFLLLSLLFHEPKPTPTLHAWGAFWFLVIFGSVIAFTSYIKALSLLPTHVVTTNTYVNPIIAVILGWLVLNEKITFWTLAAIVLVIISVAGTLRNGIKNKSEKNRSIQVEQVLE